MVKYVGKTSVLFVCLGNICRSPLGHGIFEKMLEQKGLSDKFVVDSCGTGNWHNGNQPHEGSIEVAKQNGISIVDQKSRQINLDDFENFDWIIAMDRQNFKDIKAIAGDTKAKIHLLREFDPFNTGMAVPDPYYEGGFDGVFEIIERSCAVLFKEITGKGY